MAESSGLSTHRARAGRLGGLESGRTRRLRLQSQDDTVGELLRRGQSRAAIARELGITHHRVRRSAERTAVLHPPRLDSDWIGDAHAPRPRRNHHHPHPNRTQTAPEPPLNAGITGAGEGPSWGRADLDSLWRAYGRDCDLGEILTAESGPLAALREDVESIYPAGGSITVYREDGTLFMEMGCAGPELMAAVESMTDQELRELIADGW